MIIMGRRALFLTLVAVGLFLLCLTSVSATSCGDTLLGDTTLTENLTGCSGVSGLILGANDITLNCDGYTVIMSDPQTAISGSGLNNVTIKNCKITDGANNAGIYLEYTTNSTISSSTSLGYVWGIYILGGSDNKIINSYGAGEQGIDIEGSPNTQITNSHGVGGYNGIWSLGSDNTHITNSIGESGGAGILIQNSIDNIVSSSNGTAIGLGAPRQGIYILGGSDNQILNSVSSGLDSILLESTTGAYLYGNIGGSGGDQSIHVLYSDYNTFINNVGNSNTNGFYFFQSSFNDITSCTTNSNSVYGIIINEGGSNNIVGNHMDNNGDYGLYVSVSENTLIKDNFMSSNSVSGIGIADTSVYKVYNNFFNNTVNAMLGGSFGANDWNRTKITGVNIIGGSKLGGNYWATPTDDGFSQTCTNLNGMCVESYTIDTDNTDWLPLASSTTYVPSEVGKVVKLTSITKQNTATDVKIACYDSNNTYCTGGICSITIISPNSTTLVNDQSMAYQGSFWSYHLTANQVSLTGPYSVSVVCASTTSANTNWVDIVTSTGKQFSLADVFVYVFFLLVCLGVSIFSIKLMLNNSVEKDKITSGQLYEMKKTHEFSFYLQMLKKKMWIVGVFGLYLSGLLFLSLLNQLVFSLGLSELNSILNTTVIVLGWGLIPFVLFWMGYIIIYLYKGTEEIMRYQFGGFRR